MTDPRRSDRPPTAADVPDRERERDARVEDLLLSGLDHYFAGHFELAISVWTRVLFLNHGHARARAYIERARSAISERQREGEELLHSGAEAFVRGDSHAARQLLTSAVERGGASEEALAILDRLTRLEGATGPQRDRSGHRGVGATASAAVTSAAASWRWSSPLGMASWLASVGLVALAGWVWVSGAEWPLLDAASPTIGAVYSEESLPIPTAAEAALANARRLREAGQLRQALAALDVVPPGDRLASEANALKAGIQKELLDAAADTVLPDVAPNQRGQVSRQ